MKLISDYHEWYDGVAAPDRETTPVYVRRETIVLARIHTGLDAPVQVPPELIRLSKIFKAMPCPNIPLYNLGTGPRAISYAHDIFDTCIVSFCGKLHIGYCWNYGSKYMIHPNAKYLDGFRPDNDQRLMSFDEVWAAVENWKPQTTSAAKTREMILEGRASYMLRGFTPKTWKKFRSEFSDTELSVEAHILADAPILGLRSDGKHELLVKANPELGKLGFARFYDSYTAYQMIDQYMSGQLAKQMDPLPMDDKYRIHAAGFDLKTSFRNMAPGEKKARRAAKKKK